MVISKETLKKRLLKQFYNYENHTCSICRQVIARYDIKDNNFEYVKNKLGENYAHSTCIKYRKDKK